MKEVLGLQICQHLYKSNEVCLRFCILWPTGSCFIFKRGSVSGFNQRQLTDRLTGSPKFKPSHWLLHACFFPIPIFFLSLVYSNKKSLWFLHTDCTKIANLHHLTTSYLGASKSKKTLGLCFEHVQHCQWWRAF